MKNILIIKGHPNKNSFNTALAEAYKTGASTQQVEIKEISIADLNFDPNLAFGYEKRMPHEPDLLDAWEKIKWADHLVWVHPVWWGSMPAKLKGFIDRLFLPGLAFKYRENSVWWDKLLTGKTAHIITTLDQPGWYYALVYGKPSINQLKKSTLHFCGIKPVNVTYIGIIKDATEKQRNKWLQRVESLGKKLK
ncbi:NAD(P)H-dependent oxidoreductase [Cytophaga hutchinsonii]|uniref:Probable oxidoreductase possible NAD(P)H dehydrogenase, quinone family n=1 Tax=Cytophaga hutchinsonii (strain ATCC 33406 / DSM 1761 / CIP 103989 / NBRC 15051 / NCIMB 9469 / D465) TaxID=269798 RepID=A0A6N4SN20_CYTH3|nr:NAD(P)H-dependent oxidoreductase [Cytophaga hutchinsonii]ABG57686.1 probable oxidoreductase; possible NAD(P)H dehydrogenase, quinone family [Cytophaga hutchinsonii ATCC 33406]SFX02918.1 Putative NADPH-quinone reductase (modulator of drug activity B) [Cytophaga hutchinsonii ATCC 33406]